MNICQLLRNRSSGSVKKRKCRLKTAQSHLAQLSEQKLINRKGAITISTGQFLTRNIYESFRACYAEHFSSISYVENLSRTRDNPSERQRSFSADLPSTTRSTYAITFSADKKYAAASTGDHNIHIIDINSGKIVKTLKGKFGFIGGSSTLNICLTVFCLELFKI